jgi:predicted nucleic acid-binding Zn ribbon protein
MTLPLLKADSGAILWTTATPADEFEQHPCIDCGQPAPEDEPICWACESAGQQSRISKEARQ